MSKPEGVAAAAPSFLRRDAAAPFFGVYGRFASMELRGDGWIREGQGGTKCRRFIAGTMVRRAILALALLAALAGCQSMRQASRMPSQELFIVFFQPGTVQLPPEAQDIVRQAADTAVSARVSRIEIAVPLDVGPARLREGRFTAIQNLLSAAGVAPRVNAQAQLVAPAVMFPAAVDRAEIRLIP